MSVTHLPRRITAREMLGIELAFRSLEANPGAINPRGRVVLHDGMVACLEVRPRRVVAILPADRVAW